MDKPDVLYHASSNRNLSVIEPRALSIRDSEEGPVVFAVVDKASATVFIVPTTDDWVEIGEFRDDLVGKFKYVVISDRQRFEKADQGGAIYSLPTDTFFLNTKYGRHEWTSTKSVRPISVEVVDSGLKAMLKAGVNVFFVDWETFRRIKEADDRGYKIITNLKLDNQSSERDN